MNCPVCHRTLAPTLSICTSCGSMMNDKVREELQSKVTPVGPQRLVPRDLPIPTIEQATAPEPRPTIRPAPSKRIQTANLIAPKTSPTLVAFQNKKTTVPEWRLQMQNAVQQRKGAESTVAAPSPVRAAEASTNDGEQIEDQPRIADKRVENAMKRIAESRAAFLKPLATPKRTPKPAKPTAVPIQKQFPFDVVPSPARVVQTTSTTSTAAELKPEPVAMPVLVEDKRDTNKLPPIEEVLPTTVIKKVERIESKKTARVPVAEFTDIKHIRIRVEDPEDTSTDHDRSVGEIEDLAPFSMRFGAGLFDLIIGAFGGLALISPIAFSTDQWFTTTGILTFTGAWAVFLFLYMTVSLGFYGKTLGMRLFALELVDAVENEYPTLRQAAVNSSVFILSLPLAGVGFITAIFNEEHRALHDLLSGTIQVREF